MHGRYVGGALVSIRSVRAPADAQETYTPQFYKSSQDARF